MANITPSWKVVGNREYDYPAKNAVREFLLWQLPVVDPSQSEYRHMTGLYFPGVQNLELPLFRAKGYSAKYLFGVENDEGIFGEMYGQMGGIRLVFGSVPEVVACMRQEQLPLLDFASLDFPGSYFSPLNFRSLLSLFQVFPSQRGGWLSVTSWGSRDPQVVFQGGVNLAKFFAGHPDKRVFLEHYEMMCALYERRSRVIYTPDDDQAFFRHICREVGLFWWIVLVLGVTEYSADGFRSLRVEVLERIRPLLETISQQARCQLEERPEALPFVSLDSFGELFQTLSCPYVMGPLDRVVFQTQSDKSMISWSFRLEYLSESERTLADFVVDVWFRLACSPLYHINAEGIRREV